jgi:hypothetical protein
VQMTVEPARGRPAAILRFRLMDEAGTAVTDLEQYLGSAGHLLVVSPDLTHSIHAHPEALGSGPELAFDVEFPEAGIYKLWVQMQRRGKVSAVPFVVRIGSNRLDRQLHPALRRPLDPQAAAARKDHR